MPERLAAQNYLPWFRLDSLPTPSPTMPFATSPRTRNIQRSRFRAGWVGCLIVLCSSVTLMAADRVPATKRIPRDSLFYVAIPNASVLAERASNSFLGKMFRDEEFQPFVKSFEAWFKGRYSEELEKDSGLSLDELQKLPQGEIAIALLPMDEDKLPLVAFFQFGDHREQIEKLMAKAAERAKEQGAKLSTEEIEGTEVSFLTVEPKEETDDDSNAKKNPFDEGITAWFIKDDTIVVGAGKNWPKSVLSRWDGEGTRNLADHRSFQAIMSACRDQDREPCFEFYVDPIGLMKSVLQSGEAVSPQVAIFLGFLPQLGLDKFKGMGGVYDLGWDGTEQRMRMLIQIDQPPTRLMKLFQFPPRELVPSSWVPANAGGYGAISWDLAAAWQAIGETVDTFQGRGKFDEVIARTSKEMDLGDFNLKTDLIDQFSGTIEYFVPLEAVETENEDDAASSVPKFGVGLGLTNAEAFRKTLARLSKSPLLAALEQREFEGQTIYEVSGNEAMAFTVVGDQLLITGDKELIENALRNNTGEGLRDTAEFQRYLKSTMGPFSVLVFNRGGEELAQMLEAIKAGSMGEGDGELDLSKLPDAKTIRRYLTPTIDTVKPHEQGLLLDGFSLPASDNE